MKLDKFGKIRGHRIFKNLNLPTVLEEFGRFNVIYGWNRQRKNDVIEPVQSSSGEVTLCT